MAIPGEPTSTRYKAQMILRHAWQRRAKRRGDPKQGDAKPVDAGQGNAKRARRAITREAYLTTSKATPS